MANSDKIRCRFHPTQPAHWTCNKCGASYCPGCVDEREKGGLSSGQKLHFCPSCNVEAQWIGASNLIDPFWKRLHSFFLYPVRVRPLILIFSLAAAATFLSWMPYVDFIITAIFIKYAYRALRDTSEGDLTPPEIGELLELDDFMPVLKQWILFAALYIVGGAVIVQFGIWGGIIYAAVVIFALPSMIILLVVNDRLLHAFNPIFFIGLALRIGGGYFIMWLFLAMLLGAPSAVGGYLLGFLPTFLAGIIINAAQFFYTLISYHMMGYMLLQYHDRLGYRIHYENFKDPTKPDAKPEVREADPEAPILAQIEQYIKDGKFSDAVSHVKSATVGTGIAGIALATRFYDLLKMQKHADEMAEHGEKYLHLLVKHSKKVKACEVYAECLKVNPKFSPQGYDLFKIGEWFNESQDGKAAISTLHRLTKTYPNDPLVPKAWFRIAQIYNDRLKNSEKAKQILNSLLKKYPNHDIAQHAGIYLKHKIA